MNFQNFMREFYLGEVSSFYRIALRSMLIPFVPVYTTARSLHQIYRRQLRETTNTPVVSVGNISLGGTGKTAFTLWLIEALKSNQYDVGLLKRGEGTREGFVPENEEAYTVARKYGDEAALYRYRYPEVPLGVGRDRLGLARAFDERHNLDVLLLDDGFQYRQLDRVFDLVLLDPRDVRNNWQLPAGPLREPLSSLEEADGISVKTSSDRESSDVEKTLSRYGNPPENQFAHRYVFDGVYRGSNEVTDVFKREGATLITTLARPGDLETFLEEYEIEVQRHISHPDHADLIEEDVGDLAESDNVLITEKEAVKLPGTLREKLGVVRSRLRVSGRKRLLDRIADKIEQTGGH